MSMDRARSLQIDREDLDEAGIAGLAGKILGEYVRTKVVPECDAYVLSKLSSIASNKSNLVAFNSENPLETLNRLITRVRNAVGFDEELVAFVNTGVYGLLQNSSDLSKMIITSDFKQGELNLTVKSLNGVALIPVVSERMKTEFSFENGAQGGFKPTQNAREVLMLVCPKKVAHLVRKTENMRIFTPEQNIDADAYKFDYRVYYDAFVKKSEMNTIFCCLGSEYTYTVNHIDTEVKVGYEITSNVILDTHASLDECQWYVANEPDFNAASAIKDATALSIRIPFEKVGTYYLFCEFVIDGVTRVVTEPMQVKVSE